MYKYKYVYIYVYVYIYISSEFRTGKKHCVTIDGIVGFALGPKAVLTRAVYWGVSVASSRKLYKMSASSVVHSWPLSWTAKARASEASLPS